MPDPLGELRARVQALEKENARLRAFMDDIAELHRRIVQPIIEAESRAIVEYERRDRGDEEPYGLSVMELEARYLEARKRLWRADMDAHAGDEDDEELRGESPITTALRHAQEAVRLLEELAVRAAWDAQDEILDPRRRMWEAHQAQKNVRDAAQGLWRADMDAHAAKTDGPVRCIHCKRPLDPERDGPKLVPVCADCRPKHAA